VPARLTVAGLTQRVDAETHNVSATDTLVILAELLPQGMKITIETFNEKKLEADVVGHRSSVRRARSSRSKFSASAPNFWNAFFPPGIN
jgi:hypothetical protein